jgi:hypothetical protein
LQNARVGRAQPADLLRGPSRSHSIAISADHLPSNPKAMPVILTMPDDVEAWMTAPPDKALKLQRPLSDGRLKSSPAE